MPSTSCPDLPGVTPATTFVPAALGKYLPYQAPVGILADALVQAQADAGPRIADRAELMGFPVTAPNKRTLLVHAPGGAWRIEALIADLAESPDNLPLQAADAVLSSALCDLRPAARSARAWHWIARSALRRRTASRDGAKPPRDAGAPRSASAGRGGC